MSAIANIAIQDGQATPATHTFYPVVSGNDSVWRENQSALPLIGQGTVQQTLKLDSKTGLNRVRLVLDVPALETATAANSQGYTAAPKVAYSNRVTVEFILPSRGTAAQRKDLRVMLSNLIKDATVVDTIDNLNMPY